MSHSVSFLILLHTHGEYDRWRASCWGKKSYNNYTRSRTEDVVMETGATRVQQNMEVHKKDNEVKVRKR